MLLFIKNEIKSFHLIETGTIKFIHSLKHRNKLNFITVLNYFIVLKFLYL